MTVTLRLAKADRELLERLCPRAEVSVSSDFDDGEEDLAASPASTTTEAFQAIAEYLGVRGPPEDVVRAVKAIGARVQELLESSVHAKP